MFTLKIVGLGDARDLLALGWHTRAVTVIQENAGVVPHDDTHLVIHMSDVDDPKMSKHAPSMTHLRSILAHTSNLKSEDKLLVNCWAGQSRSTATAVGILMQHGYTAQDAIERVMEERPMAIPNSLMIRHIDTYFGTGGELSNLVAAIKRSR